MSEYFEDAGYSSGLLDAPTDISSARCVDIMQSLYFNTHFNAQCVCVTLDSGATSSFMKASFAKKLGIPTKPASERARQTDGVSSL